MYFCFSSENTGTCTQEHISGIDVDAVQALGQLGQIYNPDDQCLMALGSGYGQYTSSVSAL